MSGPLRIGPEREVPPPRPVPGPGTPPPASGTPEAGGGAARAARLLAVAVAGLLREPGHEAAAGPGAAARAVGGALRDVAAAVAAAVGSGRAGAPGRTDGVAPPGDPRSGALLGDLLAAAAPRLPIRDAARLRAAHPGATDEEIADALVARAGRLTAAVGAATGGLAAAHWFAPPSLLALPLELAAETVLTAAVEVVLLGELHELHGRAPDGDARRRAAAYLAGWSAQRSVDRTGGTGPASVLGVVAFSALRRRLGRRLARSAPAAAPFLLGAALGGRGNRKATETLARRLRADLRGPRP
ncbi:hypothetical protein [Trujillonella endophytica]|uniref:Uncharacterized protein n=1 Tax=Trujillonella endophytica TaxID=673521 RepID=A0A1H8PC17_9ACTN|nr:hypothetical protein [Trujillella endophytica]SEO39529.1 hypothetical protein SAMN05660991_00094 [Trujillella endophytica]